MSDPDYTLIEPGQYDEDPDYEPGGSFDEYWGGKQHAASARKAVRREEAEERQAYYLKEVRREMGELHQDHNGPEDEIETEAKRNVDARQRARWIAQKESK